MTKPLKPQTVRAEAVENGVPKGPARDGEHPWPPRCSGSGQLGALAGDVLPSLARTETRQPRERRGARIYPPGGRPGCSPTSKPRWLQPPLGSPGGSSGRLRLRAWCRTPGRAESRLKALPKPEELPRSLGSVWSQPGSGDAAGMGGRQWLHGFSPVMMNSRTGR